MSINQIFETLASDNSRLFKIAELKKHQDNELLKEVIFLALDPFTQFYIRKIPAYSQIGTTDIGLPAAIRELQLLSSRKITGNMAIEHLRDILSNLSPDGAKVIERIISKDLKCGASEGTVNTVWPGLIHEYPCMLASGYEQKTVDKIQYPAIAQLKSDGMRFNAIVRRDTVEFRSRNGKELTIPNTDFSKVFVQMAHYYNKDMVFDGELLVSDSSLGVLDRQTGNGILSKSIKGTMTPGEATLVKCTLWDAISLEDFKVGKSNEEYSSRFTKLGLAIFDIKQKSPHSFMVNLTPSTEVASLEDAQEIFQQYLSEGQEGIILKAKDMIWENKRSKKQIKFKGELECDLKIVGLEEGRGKYQGLLGALLVESADGILKVSVGSGLTDALRAELNSTTILGKVIAVKYNARIKNVKGEESLFLPIFLEVREDKDEADYSKDIK